MQEQLTSSSSPLQAACEYFRATRSAHSLGVQTRKLQQIVVRPHTLLPFWSQQVTFLEDSQLGTNRFARQRAVIWGHSYFGCNIYLHQT